MFNGIGTILVKDEKIWTNGWVGDLTKMMNFD